MIITNTVRGCMDDDEWRQFGGGVSGYVSKSHIRCRKCDKVYTVGLSVYKASPTTKCAYCNSSNITATYCELAEVAVGGRYDTVNGYVHGTSPAAYCWGTGKRDVNGHFICNNYDPFYGAQVHIRHQLDPTET